MGPQKNLTGKIFGRLTVLQLIEPPIVNNRKGRFLWFCRCTCGNTVKIRSDRLLRGKTISCGCLLVDIRKASPAARSALYAWSKQAKERIAESRGHIGFFTLAPAKSGADRYHSLPRGSYQKLFDEQGGVCAICGSPPPAGQPLHLDHDHTTRQVRGLLCHSCNKGLGCFQDDIMRMAKAMRYLTIDRPVLISHSSRWGDEKDQDAQRAAHQNRLATWKKAREEKEAERIKKSAEQAVQRELKKLEKKRMKEIANAERQERLMALLIGKKYGMLSILDSAPIPERVRLTGAKQRNRYVLCRCDCGRETVVRVDHLRSGRTRSCGCRQPVMPYRQKSPHSHPK